MGKYIVMSLLLPVSMGGCDAYELKLVKREYMKAWLEIHHEDLEANWKLLSNGEQFFRIDPLK
ncbi:MAG: DUF4160 domain-containing protein [Clostridia bacterium]|nr:DUF4160 domain-containing protein [Clostridia bacterium]